MVRISVLKGFGPFHQDVGTRRVEDDILSKDVAWGMLDILKNAKKAVKNAVLNKIGSSRILQAREISARVERSKMPLGVGAKDEFMEILLR